MSESKIYSANEASKKMGISVATVTKYIKNGELKASKFLNRWQINEEDLNDFIKRMTK
jgi:excisionase family DNA binding protein